MESHDQPCPISFDDGTGIRLRGSGSFPSMIRARTAHRHLTKRNDSETLAHPDSVPALAVVSPLDKTKSQSKKRRRMIFSRVSRRKSLENMGILVRNQCGTAKLQWPTEKKETDTFDLLPKGCIKVRRLRFGKTPRILPDTEENYYLGDNDTDANGLPLHKGDGDAPSSLIGGENSKSINVFVRIRPKHLRELDERAVIFRTDAKTIIFDPKEKTKDFYFQGVKQSTRSDFGRKRPNRNVSFHYDKVYGPETSNNEIFNDSLFNLTDRLMEGYNCTIFAYGATGSGKTYTMIGSNTNPGISVLMVEALYKRIGELAGEFESDVVVSYLEVYNETIKDLLCPEKELSIREDGKKGIIIPELSFYRPQGPTELLKLLRCGNRARTQHATDLNAESSRSHAVFEVKLNLRRKSEKAKEGMGDTEYHGECIDRKVEVIKSKLVMVDLAGSERGAGGNDGARQREGASINKSLLALANCISALADGNSHIPYRNSKLTRLLKDALSGICTTVMIANISPSVLTYEDTYNTLKYANRAKNIVGPGSKQNVFLEDLIDDSEKSQVSELEAKVAQLSELLQEERLKKEVLEAAVNVSAHPKIPSSLSNLKETHNPTEDLFAGNYGETYKTKAGGICGTDESTQSCRCCKSLDSTKLPNEMKKYIDICTERGQVFSKWVDLAKTHKLAEWELLSTKLKSYTADYYGRLPPNSSNYEEYAKLQNEVVHLTEVVETGKEEPAKCALVFKNLTQKMESVQEECVNNFYEPPEHNDQQKTTSLPPSASTVHISLEEFLVFKRMLSEREGNGKLEQFYHTFCQRINDQLISSEMNLLTSLNLIKSMYAQLEAGHGLTSAIQAEYKQLVSYIHQTTSSAGLLKQLGENGGSGHDRYLKNSSVTRKQGRSPSNLFQPGTAMFTNTSDRRSSLIAEHLTNMGKFVEQPLLTQFSVSQPSTRGSEVNRCQTQSHPMSPDESLTQQTRQVSQSQLSCSSAEVLYNCNNRRNDGNDNLQTTADDSSSKETLSSGPEVEFIQPTPTWAAIHAVESLTSILYENAVSAAAVATRTVLSNDEGDKFVKQNPNSVKFSYKTETGSGRRTGRSNPGKSPSILDSSNIQVKQWPLTKQRISDNSTIDDNFETCTSSVASSSAENVTSRLNPNLEKTTESRWLSDQVGRDGQRFATATTRKERGDCLALAGETTNGEIYRDKVDLEKKLSSSFTCGETTPSSRHTKGTKAGNDNGSRATSLNKKGPTSTTSTTLSAGENGGWKQRKPWSNTNSCKNESPFPPMVIPAKCNTGTNSSYPTTLRGQPRSAAVMAKTSTQHLTRQHSQQPNKWSNRGGAAGTNKKMLPGSAVFTSTSQPEFVTNQEQKQRFKVTRNSAMALHPNGLSNQFVQNDYEHVDNDEMESSEAEESKPIDVDKEVHNELLGQQLSSARSSINNKAPYHTNSKTFTISREALPTHYNSAGISPQGHLAMDLTIKKSLHSTAPVGSNGHVPKPIMQLGNSQQSLLDETKSDEYYSSNDEDDSNATNVSATSSGSETDNET